MNLRRDAIRRPRLDLTSALRLAELADYVAPFALRVACSLGIADHLAGGPRGLAELASATGTHAPSLQRLLRALATFGLFCEVEPGRFALTATVDLLRHDRAGSLAGAYPFVPADVLAWSEYEQGVRTGNDAAARLDGEDGGRREDGLTDPDALRLRTLADRRVPFAIRVACDLRIADALAGGPLTADDLAAVGAHPPALLGALRALGRAGVLNEADGRFALEPLGQLLRDDHPLGLRELYTLLPGEIRAWSALDHSVRTGEAAFDRVNGECLWDYLDAHADEGARFTATQRAVTRLELRAALTAHPWADLRTVVDVGGGDGALLAGLLSRFDRLRGVLFDLPYALDGAAAALTRAGVRDRCEIVPGSFFDRVPEGEDAYVLKRVLYCWTDEPALALLRAVRAAMRPDSRLLVMEPLSRPSQGFDVGTLLDVLLLVLTGAGARTPDQMESLFERAGLRLERVVSTPMLPVVEARRQ